MIIVEAIGEDDNAHNTWGKVGAHRGFVFTKYQYANADKGKEQKFIMYLIQIYVMA